MTSNRSLARRIMICLCMQLISNVSNGQENKLQVALYPIAGNYTSYPKVVYRSFSWENSIIKSILPSNASIIGFGFQFNFLEDWQTNMEYGFTGVGGGFTTELIGTNGLNILHHKKISASITNIFSINTERKIIDFANFRIRRKLHFVRLSGLAGASVLWMPWYQRDDQNSRSTWGSGSTTNFDSRQITKAHRNAVGTLNAGFTLQWFKEYNPKLKVSCVYSYGLNGLYEDKYYNTFLGQYQEDFTLHTGQHNIALTASWPIILLRNKAYKEWLEGEQSYYPRY